VQNLIASVIENMRANPVAWLALAVSTLSAALTIWRSRRDFRRQSSHDYLNAATELLERAYDLFDKARDTEWNGLPKPDLSRTMRHASSSSQAVRHAVRQPFRAWRPAFLSWSRLA
jgi:hypothetical protein